MGQISLFSDDAPKDCWQPAAMPFRLRPLARNARRKPLPGQLYLSGMTPTDDAAEVSAVPGDDDLALREERAGGTLPSQPICPNCGGTKFDADGDCTSCWEPAVVEPSKHSGTMLPPAR